MDSEDTSKTTTLGICDYFDDTESIHLRYTFSRDEVRIQNTAEKCLAFSLELSPFFRPLCVNLVLEGFPRNDLMMSQSKENLYPPNPAFQLREKHIPSWVKPDVLESDRETTLVDEITADALIKWLRHVVSSREDPSAEHILVIAGLYVNCSRTRLLDEKRWEGKDKFPLAMVRDGSVHTVPIEKRKDGLWVSGPILDSDIAYPALTIHCYTEFAWQIQYEMICMWSWWYMRGSKEHMAFQQALRNLKDKGWELTHRGRDFEERGNSAFDIT